MIVHRTSRAEILTKLQKKVSRRQPVFIASAVSGLVAKLLEQSGVDCINTFSGARLRANGRRDVRDRGSGLVRSHGRARARRDA